MSKPSSTTPATVTLSESLGPVTLSQSLPASRGAVVLAHGLAMVAAFAVCVNAMARLK